MDSSEEVDSEAAVEMIVGAILEGRQFLPEERRRFKALTAIIRQELRGAGDVGHVGEALLEPARR